MLTRTYEYELGYVLVFEIAYLFKAHFATDLLVYPKMFTQNRKLAVLLLYLIIARNKI